MKTMLRNQNGKIPRLGLFIVLAVAIIAAGSIYYVVKNDKTTNNNTVSVTSGNSNANTNVNQIIGGDRDAHGCIGSAGYTWCEIKAKCLRTWEETCSVTDANANSNPNPNSGGAHPTDWLSYSNTQYGVTFGYPAEWPVPVVVPSATDGAFPAQWRIEVGPIVQGACEGENCYEFEILGYLPTLAFNDAFSASTIVSDTTNGGIRTVVDLESGIGTSRNAYIFGEKYTVRLFSRSDADPTLFDQMLATLKTTSQIPSDSL